MGSVYKITDGELVYYGSTTSSLTNRLGKHKCPSSKTNCNLLNKEKMTIELVEAVEDEEQLKWRERYYIENNECVNKYLPIYTDEERKQNAIISRREYYERNKKTFQQNAIKPYQCECGSVITWGHRHNHFKSKKHINNINE